MASTSQIDLFELVQRAIHETKKPLSLIIEGSQVLPTLPTKPIGKRGQKTVELMQESSEQALAFMQAMWEVIKIDSLQPDWQSRTIDFIIKEVEIKISGIDKSSASVQIEPNLPLIEVDVARLVRATGILYSHAAKSSGQNKVTINAFFDTPYVIVSIGEGRMSKRSASAEALPTLPKEQAKGIDSVELLLVSRIIAQHNGNFWLSEGPRGSVRFNYALPPAIEFQMPDKSS